MLARFASVYVRCLLVVELLFLGVSLSVHVGALLGINRIFPENGKYLFYCALIASIPAVSLAEEKNVWKNEFKRCPKWLRAVTLTLMIYGIVVASAQVFFSNRGSFEDQPLFASGASLFFESMPLCILYSLLWAGPSELVKRVRVSIITLAVCLAFVIAVRLGYLPHRARY